MTYPPVFIKENRDLLYTGELFQLTKFSHKTSLTIIIVLLVLSYQLKLLVQHL